MSDQPRDLASVIEKLKMSHPSHSGLRPLLQNRGMTSDIPCSKRPGKDPISCLNYDVISMFPWQSTNDTCTCDTICMIAMTIGVWAITHVTFLLT